MRNTLKTPTTGSTIKKNKNINEKSTSEKQMFRRRTSINILKSDYSTINKGGKYYSISYIPFIKSLSTQSRDTQHSLPQANSNTYKKVVSNNNNNNNNIPNDNNSFKASTKLLKRDLYISPTNSISFSRSNSIPNINSNSNSNSNSHSHSNSNNSAHNSNNNNNHSNSLSNISVYQKRELMHTSPVQSNCGLRSSTSNSNMKHSLSSSSLSSQPKSSFTASDNTIKPLVSLIAQGSKISSTINNSSMNTSTSSIPEETSNSTLTIPELSSSAFITSSSMNRVNSKENVNEKDQGALNEKPESTLSIPKISNSKTMKINSNSTLSLTPSYCQQDNESKNANQASLKLNEKILEDIHPYVSNNNIIQNDQCKPMEDNSKKSEKSKDTKTTKEELKPIFKKVGFSASKAKLEEIKKENEMFETNYSNLNNKFNNYVTSNENNNNHNYKYKDKSDMNDSVDRDYTPYSTLLNLYNYDNNIYHNFNNMLNDDHLLGSDSFLRIKKNKLNNKTPIQKQNKELNFNKTSKSLHNQKNTSKSQVKSSIYSHTKNKPKNEIKPIKINNKITVSLTNVNGKNNSDNVSSETKSNNTNKKFTINNNAKKNNSKWNQYPQNFIGIPNINDSNVINKDKGKPYSTQKLISNFNNNLTIFPPNLLNNVITTIEIPISDDIPEISY